MATIKRGEWIKFGADVARLADGHNTVAVAGIADRVARLATRHRRLCECTCSFPDPERGKPWDDQLDLCERVIKRIASIIGLRVMFQRDPRGCTVRIQRDKDDTVGIPVPSTGLPARAFERRA